jgi:predicted Zn-dependent protease
MRKGMLLRVVLFSILVMSGFYGACVRNPVTGARQLALISESQEIAMGQESHPEVLAQFGSVDNAALQEYVTRIGNDLAKVSHRPDLPWHFTVVDDSVVNAFAVPGGYIYLTRGILEHMNNEAEMAGVLGHEIGHVTARHSVTQISQGQLMSLGLGLGSIFSSRFSQVSGLAQMGLEVLMLKYSRDHERQSDQLGLDYMARCGYDPTQMSKFFQVFVGMSEESGRSIPNWLSSHPSPPDRIERTTAEGNRIKQESGRQDYKINADEFLPRLENLVYGENPREGFVEKGRFVHPDLRFQMDIPQSWEVENTKSAVFIAEPEGGAVVQLSLIPPEAGQSPGAVAQNIGRQQGHQLLSGRSEQINGKQAYLGLYRVMSDSGSIGVTAAFISHGGNIYQIAGLAPESTFSRYSRSLDAVIRSFRDLTDPKLLAIQPDRMKLYRARKGDTLRSLAKSMDQSRVDLEDLVRINRIDPDQPLSAGAWVKLVQLGRR